MKGFSAVVGKDGFTRISSDIGSLPSLNEDFIIDASGDEFNLFGTESVKVFDSCEELRVWSNSMKYIADVREFAEEM